MIQIGASSWFSDIYLASMSVGTMLVPLIRFIQLPNDAKYVVSRITHYTETFAASTACLSC